MPSFKEASKNLKKYDEKTQRLVLELYNEVEETLKELIVDNSVQLRQAQARLMREYDKALASTDFIANWSKATVDAIVASTYDKQFLTKSGWEEYLLGKSLFKDKVKLSTRIRNNGKDIIRDQRIILKRSLKEGKNIAQIVGNIAEDNLKGFKRELPKYLADLKGASLSGTRVSQKRISALKKQVLSLKTEGLKADYKRLISTLIEGGDVDKAVYFAMERRTKYYAQRLARSETMRTMSVYKNHKAMRDEDTQYVKNVTQGSNPCPYCVAVENLGFVPVANATIATHHPHCSCTQEYKKTIKRPKAWSNAKYKSKLQSEIDKMNARAERKGSGKTYILPQTPVNLRSSDLMSDLK